MNTCPILMTVFYTLQEGHTASVRLAGESDAHTLLTLVHTAIDAPDTGHIRSFVGDESSPRFTVADRDVLVLIAQQQGAVVASQCYEVDARTKGDYLLIPRGGFNVLCEQQEQGNAAAEYPTPNTLLLGVDALLAEIGEVA